MYNVQIINFVLLERANILVEYNWLQKSQFSHD